MQGCEVTDLTVLQKKRHGNSTQFAACKFNNNHNITEYDVRNVLGDEFKQRRLSVYCNKG